MKVLVAQLLPTLCDPTDDGPPGSSVHGSLQARILEWVAIPFSGDLPNLGIKSGSPAWQADSLPSEPPGKLDSSIRNGTFAFKKNLDIDTNTGRNQNSNAFSILKDTGLPFPSPMHESEK